MSLGPEEARSLHGQIPEWTLADRSLKREFTFKDFREAIAFVNRVADAAESMNHHPDIVIAYNKVTLTLSTHKSGGLTRHDFILAAKINRVTSDEWRVFSVSGRSSKFRRTFHGHNHSPLTTRHSPLRSNTWPNH